MVLVGMVETDLDPSKATLYVYYECGTGGQNTEQTSDCPQRSGRTRSTTVAHD
jgi:hypothetical protein